MAREWASALCWGCVNHNDKKPGTCEAFLGGIPHIILSNEANHFEKLEGQQNDFVYEKEESK